MEYKGLLERVLREEKGLEGLDIKEVREVSVTNPGDNYMSVVGVLEIEGTVSGGSYCSKVFFKRPPDSPEYRTLFRIEDAFNNEVVFYTLLLPLYDIRISTPRCLYAARDVILLEDLHAQGYVMTDRTVCFDFATSAMILEAIATYHAASYHTSLAKREQFTRVTGQLKTFGFILTSLNGMVEQSVKRTIQLSDGEEGVDEVLSFLQSIDGKVSEVIRALRTPDDLAVVCHGDFWINNILLRHGCGEDSVRIVDLQSCAVAHLAVDIWSFLYTSTQEGVKNHINDLIQIYCVTFLDKLNSMNPSTNSICSLTDMIKGILSRELYGFLVAAMYLPALYMPKDKVVSHENLTKEQLESEDFVKQYGSKELKGAFRKLVKLVVERKVIHNLSSI